MVVGLDLSSDIISFSYYENDIIKTCYIMESLGFRTKDLFDDDKKISNTILFIKEIVKRKINSDIYSAVIAIPAYCDYLQIKKIKQIAEKHGISVRRMASGNAYSAYDICNEMLLDAIDGKENRLICSINSDYAEITMFEFGEDFLEILGSIVITFSRVDSEENIERLKLKIISEIKQFLKDQYVRREDIVDIFISDKSLSENIKKAFLGGVYSVSRIRPIFIGENISKGALLQSKWLEGDLDTFMLYVQNIAINAGIGEEGEYKKIIDYYTPIPICKKEKVFVSNEFVLKIYEGNYLNRKHDRVIAMFDIPESLEGKYILVSIDISYNYVLSIHVEDEDGNEIIKNQTL